MERIDVDMLPTKRPRSMAFGVERKDLQQIEEAFSPDLSDEKLLKFFMLAMMRGGPDTIYDVVTKQASDLILSRLEGGYPENLYSEERDSFESEEAEKALIAARAGNLRPDQLLSLYYTGYINNAEDESGPQWQSVHELCHSQILQRMAAARSTGAGVVSLPAGYDTGQFARAQNALAASPSPERLMDLLLLADERDQEKESHKAPYGDWQRLRDEAGIMLMRKLTGQDEPSAHQDWRDPDAVWTYEKCRHARKSIPNLANGDLLTLFIQAADNAFMNDGEPMQGRWERVTAECRVEILKRIDAVVAGQASPGAYVATDFISVREALRVAEVAFRPDISDEKLVDLYLLVTEVGHPEFGQVFDEIKEAVSSEVKRRMRAGTPAPELCEYRPIFDYPDHNKKAIKAIIAEGLPHENLLLLFRYSWDDMEEGSSAAVYDLCRGQILRRMKPPKARPGDWEAIEDGKRIDLVRRVLAHDKRQTIGEAVQ